MKVSEGMEFLVYHLFRNFDHANVNRKNMTLLRVFMRFYRTYKFLPKK